MRHVDRFRHGAAVMRNNDEHIDAPADQRLHVADLTRVVAVRRLNQHVRAKLLRARHKQVAVSLPAFLLQSVHRKTDDRFGARPDAFCRRTAARNNQARDQTDDARSDNQKKPESHFNGEPC